MLLLNKSWLVYSIAAEKMQQKLFTNMPEQFDQGLFCLPFSDDFIDTSPDS